MYTLTLRITKVTYPLIRKQSILVGLRNLFSMSKEGRRQLYPEIEPYSSGTLQVSDIHTVYYEESGNPNGKPVVCLHGGPGGGSIPLYRRFFNPEKYRIGLHVICN